MNPKRFVIGLSAIIFSLGICASGEEYNFETGNGGTLPEGYRQIKDTHCGGTFEIVDAPCGSRKKALKLTAEDKKAVRILFDRRPRVAVRTGDVILFEYNVKGTGSAGVGYYGWSKGETGSDFGSAFTKVNGDTWQKIAKELTVKKTGIIEIAPFFQTSDSGIIYSDLKLTIIEQ